jgi:hypothetical protein
MAEASVSFGAHESIIGTYRNYKTIGQAVRQFQFDWPRAGGGGVLEGVRPFQRIKDQGSTR